MSYITLTLRHINSGREVEYTTLADTAREALIDARCEYPAKEYTYVSFDKGAEFV